jgi:Zn-finger nucleic acid-binding protein
LKFGGGCIKIGNVDKLIEIQCPNCHASLWVDAEKKNVVQHKRSEKKTVSSFEELLSKEKEKKEAVDERFSQAKSLEQAKKKKAADLFEQTIKEK